MKKSFYILAALIACFAISCKKEMTNEETQNNVETPEVEMQTITFTATIDEEITKSYYAGGTTFNWNEGDEISVIASDEKFYIFTANSTGTSTTFTGTIPSGKTLGAYALFPADAGHTHGNFFVPQYKDLTSHASAEIPMVGLKGEGNVYAFAHCAGAALLTVENIPDAVTSATITVESYNSENPSECYKLSGSFWISGRESAPTTTTPKWSGAYAATDAEKQFSRKVTVSSHIAQLYIPCPAGADNWVPNKLTVIGHTSEGNITLYDEKPMKKLGTVARAHVLPLTPLVYSQLGRINWASIDMYPDDAAEAFPASGGSRVKAWKVTSDSRFIYIYMKYDKSDAASKGTGNYLVVGFDTDNNPSTGLGSPDPYVGSVEARAYLYPVTAYSDGVFTFGVKSGSKIETPVGTETGTPGHVGSVDASDIYAEIAIDRTKIGSPSGSIGIIVAVRSDPAAEQTVILN